MSQLEDAYFTRFRKFRDTCQARDPDLEKWRRVQIKWASITSQGLDKIWEAAIPEALKGGDMETLHAVFFQSHAGERRKPPSLSAPWAGSFL